MTATEFFQRDHCAAFGKVGLLALVVITYLVLGASYGLVTPCFEKGDEWSHLSLVYYLATHRSLPPPVVPDRRASGPDVAWFLEYHEPPLYYAPPLYHGLAALLTSGANMNMDDLPRLLVPSPSWELGWAPEANSSPRNKNIYVHRADEDWAHSGTVRATVLLRLVSLGLGAVTVVCTYMLARLLWPERRFLAAGAAAFVAFNPQFLHLSSGVTNDNLLNALFGLFLVLALRWGGDGAAWGRWAMLGGLAGVGLLTKQSALLMLPLGLLALVWQRKGGWHEVLISSLAFLALALGIGGWWYVRNGILYSDPLGLEPHFAAQVPLRRFGLTEALMTARSYWAAFGWAPILVEPSLYVAVAVVILAGLVGASMAVRPGGSLWRAPPETRRGLAVLGLAFALNVLGFVRWAVGTGAPTGRLLFPTLPVVGVLVAWGLSHWARWSVGRWGLGVAVMAAFLCAAVIPWRYLRPAYASPLLPNGMPDTAEPVGLAFQGGVQLAGYEALAGDLRPGDEFRLTLYWHAPTGPERRYRVWVQLGPPDPTRKVAQDDFWLGGTLYPSDLWRAGDTVRQTYHLSVPGWAPAPALYWVRAGLVGDGGVRIRLADQSSDMLVLGPWRMRAASPPPAPACATGFRLESGIRLLGYDLEWVGGGEGAELHLSLHWRAEQVPNMDYTVYVHVMDDAGRLLGQHDGPPRDGAYPTSWWLPGDVVVDRHVVRGDEISAGSAHLLVGMYDPATLMRLPAYDDAGRRLPGDAIPLGEVPSEGRGCAR